MTDLTVYSSIGVRSATEELFRRFEKQNGSRLAVTWGTAPMLVARIEAGERADVVHAADIVEEHQTAVFGTVLRIVHDRELAADVANRAFYKAYSNLDTFDTTRPLRPWLIQIAAR